MINSSTEKQNTVSSRIPPSVQANYNQTGASNGTTWTTKPEEVLTRELTITIAGSAKSKNWAANNTSWDAFCERLRTPIRTNETYAEYCKLSKAKQSTLKDVGGFVGGAFAGSRRLTQQMTKRDLITLDLDTIPANKTQEILADLEKQKCTAAVYSTRKHCDRTPRLRVILPLSRSVSAEEYEPIARKACELMGFMDYADPTTFEAGRVMYWPSCSRDSNYVYRVYTGGVVDPDRILASYRDWRDISDWPQVPGVDAIHKRALARAQDPEEKRGYIGAFCQTYSITDAMDKFLPGLYEETNSEDRRTYTGGSTYGGAVIYDDKFLFSHHATDPCGGQLVNAWDLVRIQKFASDGRDDNVKDGTPVTKYPSYLAMLDLAKSDKAVASRNVQNHIEDKITAVDAFGNELPTNAEKVAANGTETVSDGAQDGEAGNQTTKDSWLTKLAVDGNGNLAKTVSNFVLILNNDDMLKGAIATEVFSNRGVIKRPVPWDTPEERVFPRRYTDTDDANIRSYIEARYGLFDKGKLLDAVAIVGNQHKFNVLADYLRPLVWDGKKRVETLLPDYLGSEDNVYTRAVMRKFLSAAVARAMTVDTEVKFDPMPILAGPQGIGKSTFLRYLAKNRAWFNESLTTFDGKDAAEAIQGSWIVEVGELAAMTRQETNAVKFFISKTTDTYRAAYARNVEDRLRRCVFCGTTNDYTFLRDQTGNRRFWPVSVGEYEPTKSVFTDLPGEVDQIWAEAKMYYQLGEVLDLTTKETVDLANEARDLYRESSEFEGIIEEFLNEPIPEEWYDMDATARKVWRANAANLKRTDLPKRTKVCVAEIWAECLGNTRGRITRADSMQIVNAMRNIPGWTWSGQRRFGIYGKQKSFVKKEDK